MAETIIISAITKDRVIGKGPDIPWHISEDFNLFKEKTTGNVVVMGSTTYFSMGKALPNRYNVVLNKDFLELSDAIVFTNYEKAIEHANEYAEENNCKVFIIGGASIYAQGLKYANKLYLSLVKKKYKGDVFFPEFENEWERTDEFKEFEEFTFTVWKRKSEWRNK